MSGVMLGPNHPNYGKPLDTIEPATRPRCKPAGRWSRDYDCCQRCQTTERSYKARGMCSSCYHRAYMAGEFDS